jgi:hypothetical protein
MSGVFLTVWDDKCAHESPVLKSTRGGYPHITLAYTGKARAIDELVDYAVHALRVFAGQDVVLVSAYINSFEDRPGHMRHDVLMELNGDMNVLLARERAAITEAPLSGKFHVTHATFELWEEAQGAVEALNGCFMPYRVRVTGVTVD